MKLANGRLAICIPTYNRAEILRNTLLHLAQHTDLIDEIVICDNASPDHTRDVVEDCRKLFPSLIYFRHNENGGAWRNIHAALSITQCTYQYLLSDDDRILIDGIRIGLDILSRDPQAVAVYGGYKDIGEDGVERLEVSFKGDRVRYNKDQKLEVLQAYYYFWFPLCVSASYQRHCMYDGMSTGWWTLVDQLLNAGSIWLIPELFYEHNATAGRLELSLTEPWYQEFHRADVELILGQIKPQPSQRAQIAEFVAVRHKHVQELAMTAARTRGDGPLERFYLLRQRAYGWRSTSYERDWEERALVVCALGRLIEKIRLLGSRRVLIQQDAMNLGGLSDAIIQLLPNVEIVALELMEFLAVEGGPTDILVAESWDLFDVRQDAGISDGGAGRVAFVDFLKLYKLSDKNEHRILRGPCGSLHEVDL